MMRWKHQLGWRLQLALMVQVFAAIPIMVLVAYWGNNMPVQMIELEEVQMIETSDDALEAVGRKVIDVTALQTQCPC